MPFGTVRQGFMEMITETRPANKAMLTAYQLLVREITIRGNKHGDSSAVIALATRMASDAYVRETTAWQLEKARRLRGALPNTAPQYQPPVPGGNWQRRPPTIRITCGTPKEPIYV
jgi:hypothetical protein